MLCQDDVLRAIGDVSHHAKDARVSNRPLELCMAGLRKIRERVIFHAPTGLEKVPEAIFTYIVGEEVIQQSTLAHG